tara:strand:- start:48 stop:152 length:105 start_codon:yes stop_codon:yes gene_type:complete
MLAAGDGLVAQMLHCNKFGERLMASNFRAVQQQF